MTRPDPVPAARDAEKAEVRDFWDEASCGEDRGDHGCGRGFAVHPADDDAFLAIQDRGEGIGTPDHVAPTAIPADADDPTGPRSCQQIQKLILPTE